MTADWQERSGRSDGCDTTPEQTCSIPMLKVPHFDGAGGHRVRVRAKDEGIGIEWIAWTAGLDRWAGTRHNPEGLGQVEGGLHVY
mmetsp:Transcript_55829/g.110825  ORF Transcript_55829/g.110825 Transcript_55829/m.110825 type:complete len:85 (-) Transcript_55829:35-289(-)